MGPDPEKAAPGSLQNIWTGGHFLCYFGSLSIVAYRKVCPLPLDILAQLTSGTVKIMSSMVPSEQLQLSSKQNKGTESLI